MILRIGSPSGRSIFTTSAPQSARTAAAEGTNPCSEKSTTLMPASGSVIAGRYPGPGDVRSVDDRADGVRGHRAPEHENDLRGGGAVPHDAGAGGRAPARAP